LRFGEETGSARENQAMTKASELREMSDEQLTLTLKETTEHFFRLRLQAQTERLDAPSELRKQRQLIARIKTIQTQREQPQAERKQSDAQTN
jgi:large subunit ribosomal protein L29